MNCVEEAKLLLVVVVKAPALGRTRSTSPKAAAEQSNDEAATRRRARL